MEILVMFYIDCAHSGRVRSRSEVGSGGSVGLAMGFGMRGALLLTLLALSSEALGVKLRPRFWSGSTHCLSWRLGVETNNIKIWGTVPAECLRYVQHYMLEGQYERDLNVVFDQIFRYVSTIRPARDGMDAWILDVDDTCISNLGYYKRKRYGVDPYNPLDFKSWASEGCSPAIPPSLQLYQHLIQSGFKVFLVTGRDRDSLGQVTVENLINQGFVGHEMLILRGPEFRGQSATVFKSAARKTLVEKGYRIRGNVGDQWSDLDGDDLGDRTFKLPNPMYCVP